MAISSGNKTICPKRLVMACLPKKAPNVDLTIHFIRFRSMYLFMDALSQRFRHFMKDIDQCNHNF